MTETSGWQDIATAPKDGSRVLIAVRLYNQEPDEPAVVGEAYFRTDSNDFYVGWWWANSDPGDYSASAIEGEPSVWMPLPAPPESQP